MEITLKKIVGHFKTITKHRHTVIAHSAKAGIIWRGLLHDLSKYTPSEFLSGARYYCGYKSPNEQERELFGYSPAWLHHKGRNKHHFEYWTDYDTVTHKIKAVPMPDKYIAEMFCDRVAASKIYQGDKYTDSHPIEYFLKSKETRFIEKETSDKIERLLRILAEKGRKRRFLRLEKCLKIIEKNKQIKHGKSCNNKSFVI